MTILRLAAAWIILLAACAPAAPDSEGLAAADSGQTRLSSPRAVHASVTLGDGRLLLIGGCSVDGCDPGPGSSTVDMIDPRTGALIGTGRLASVRIGAAAARLAGDRVLVIGGWNGPAPTASAEIYDPVAGRSSTVAPMAQARADASVVELADGRILIAGGYDGRARLASAEIFDPRTGQFTRSGAMATARSGATAVRLRDGRVLVAGGATGVGNATKVTGVAEIFDPVTGAFSPTGSLGEARYKHAALLLDSGEVLIVAGADERDYAGKKTSLELYDPRRGAFRPAGRLHAARFKLGESVLRLDDGRIFIAGGAPRPEIYDPVSGAVQMVEADLEGSWSFMTASRLADGRVLLAGGYREGRIEVSDRVWLLSVPG